MESCWKLYEFLSLFLRVLKRHESVLRKKLHFLNIRFKVFFFTIITSVENRLEGD